MDALLQGVSIPLIITVVVIVKVKMPLFGLRLVDRTLAGVYHGVQCRTNGARNDPFHPKNMEAILRHIVPCDSCLKRSGNV